MPEDVTDWSDPGVPEFPEDDLSVSASGLTGLDWWYEYLQKKRDRFCLDEANWVLHSSTCPHSPDEKRRLSEAADRLQSSSAVLESFAAEIPAHRRGEYYKALRENGNAHHDIGALTILSPAAFQRSKRDLNAVRGKRARYGKMLKKASRSALDEIKRKAVEAAIAKRPTGRFSVTRADAAKLCPAANAILKELGSSSGIALDDEDLMTVSQTVNLLSALKNEKKSGL